MPKQQLLLLVPGDQQRSSVHGAMVGAAQGDEVRRRMVAPIRLRLDMMDIYELRVSAAGHTATMIAAQHRAPYRR